MSTNLKGPIPESFGQVSLDIPVQRERDRNFHLGGRSFYFFDFDDNVVHLHTKIIVFHKVTGAEKEISTTDYPVVHPLLGKVGGEWEHFEARDQGTTNSYRNFREVPADLLKGAHQPLVADMLSALQNPYQDWRGPSWAFFEKAVNNNRPISVITARGHHPYTIRRAIDLLVLSGDLGAHPNYLSVYPVSNPEVRHQLGDIDMKLSTAQLKKIAIKVAVADAFACYGHNPHHRFGMSDDDPYNVALIVDAMRELKQLYPENAFYAFNTYGGKIVREEVLVGGDVKRDVISSEDDTAQTSLF